MHELHSQSTPSKTKPEEMLQESSRTRHLDTSKGGRDVTLGRRACKALLPGPPCIPTLYSESIRQGGQAERYLAISRLLGAVTCCFRSVLRLFCSKYQVKSYLSNTSNALRKSPNKPIHQYLTTGLFTLFYFIKTPHLKVCGVYLTRGA